MNNASAPLPSLTVQQLQQLRTQPEPIVLLDVREPAECAICAVPDAVHIPMRDIAARVDELPRHRPIAVLCHHGVRSGLVTQFLLRHGFEALNVTGGIDAWAAQVDPGMARY